MVAAIHAYDIAEDGRAAPVEAFDHADAVRESFAYRWLHFDVNEAGIGDWLLGIMPPVAAETLTQAETRPRCDEFPNGAAINLRGVNLNPEQKAEDMVSLRIWATERLIVTTRVRRVMTINDIAERCAANHAPRSVGAFLFAVADGLTDRTESVALSLEDRTDALEEAEIGGGSVPADDVAVLRRAVIMIRRFAAPQREALTRLASLQKSFLDEATRISIREAANRAARNAEALEALRERLAVLQDHIDARANEGMGRNSYVLGVAAAIFLPLGFLTGLFGVNVAGMPGVDTPSAFWLLTGAMVAIGVGLTVVFRWMRWF